MKNNKPSSPSASLTIFNPYNQQLLAELPWAQPREIEDTLSRLSLNFLSYKNWPAYRRSRWLQDVAERLKGKRDTLAQIICQEAGKPLSLALAEVDRAHFVLEWAASSAIRWGHEPVLKLDAAPYGRSGWGLTQRFPRGVVFGITPFNFPLNLLVHKVAPALASGNAVLIKPSPFTPLTAQLFFQILMESFKNLGEEESKAPFALTIAKDEDAARICQDPRVAMISFTGSARVGWMIREANPRKMVTLELGGNAWCVLAEDFDQKAFEALLPRLVSGCFSYAGQSCISVQNIAWPRHRDSQFRPLLENAVSQFRFGDPLDKRTLCGPVIHHLAKERLHRLAEEAQARGTPCTQSSQRTGESPNLVAPTVFWSPAMDSDLVAEEAFGPFVSAHSYDTSDQWLKFINESRFGLQAGLFTQDLQLIEHAFHQLHVGGLVVNDLPTTRYDHQPYGGIKESGTGREGIEAAMTEMTEPKFLALSSIRLQ